MYTSSKSAFSFVTATIALLSLIFVCMVPMAVNAKEKVYRMKIQSLFPRGDISMDLLKEFADSAEKNSNGRLKIKVFAEPEIVPGDQLFGATKQGVVDILSQVCFLVRQRAGTCELA